MWSKYICFAFTGIFLKLSGVFSDDDCKVTHKPKLQIVFVVDYVLARNNSFIKAQNLTASHLIDFIKHTFQAEFAVTAFIDYPDSAGPRAITSEEHCYIFLEELTADKNKILAAISKDPFPPGSVGNWSNHNNDHSDSVTTAMLLSAVDTRLKWNHGFYDKQGNLVRKIMIPMVFRRVTRILETPGNRTKPKADGSDKCETALIPEIQQLNQVFWDNQFTVVNSILNTEVYLVDDLYRDLFAGLFVPYYQVPIPKAGEFLSDADKFDYKDYAKRVYDIISQEVMSCDWEDPVGYNSLGL